MQFVRLNTLGGGGPYVVIVFSSPAIIWQSSKGQCPASGSSKLGGSLLGLKPLGTSDRSGVLVTPAPTSCEVAAIIALAVCRCRSGCTERPDRGVIVLWFMVLLEVCGGYRRRGTGYLNSEAGHFD